MAQVAGLINRRGFVALMAVSGARACNEITRPLIPEDACPLVRVEPEAKDGHHGLGFLRKPPGAGRAPGVVIIHGGLRTMPEDQLRNHAASGATPSRFLAAGFATLTITYRGRDDNPQSRVSLEDCLAAVDFLKRTPGVDAKSIVVFGCSGGGDLALEVAAATDAAAAVPEEPASMLLTGIFNSKFPKKGERFTPADAAPISENPKLYYTAEYQRITRAKLSRIRCPILIIQGDVHRVNHFNAEVLIPELRAAGKKVEVLTYAGQPHCFCFSGGERRPARPEAAAKAFHDIEAFCRKHVASKPRPMDRGQIKYVAVNQG